MNKKYLSAILFGTLLASSTGTFTSCKDYDDDIKGLQEQIDGSQTSVAALEKQLATLDAAAKAAQAAADAAKTAADAAKTAADAAKAAGDKAAADAAQAKADAAAAQLAAANAKKEAIAEATKQVEALKTLLQASIDGKVDKTVYDAAVNALGGRIDGIEAGLNNLTTGQVATNTADIKDAKEAIATLMAAYENLKLQSATLEEYKEACADYTANAEAIKKSIADVAIAQAEIVKLWDEINGEGGLKDLIDGNATDITNLKNQTATDISDLESRINDQLTGIKNDIKDNIKPAITKIQDQIRNEILPDLDQLHVLVVARLSSITFAPDYIVSGVEAIKFNSLQYDAMVNDENAEIPTIYKFSTASLATARYHFNPTSFILTNATYGYIDRTATVIDTRAVAASKWVEIVGAPEKNLEEGTVEFKLLRLNAHSTQPAEGKTNLVALQATLQGDAVDKGETGVVVTSPYVSVYDDVLGAEDVRIADKATLVAGKEKAHYATTFKACADLEARYITYNMVYDKVFNLKDLVATCYGNGSHEKFPIEDYKLSYKFSVASSSYQIENGGTVTDQQDWFICNDAKEGLYQAKGFNKELVGRTPIVKVELVDEAGKVVRRSFVKLIIGVDKFENMTVGTTETLTYECGSTTANFEISEQFIRDNVYRVITNGKETSLSHQEFWTLYNAAEATVAITKNGKSYSSMTSEPKIVDGLTSAGVATKKITWAFTHGELGAISTSGSTFVASVTVNNNIAASEFPAKVTFTITVDVALPQPTWAGTPNAKFWENNMYLAYVSTPQTVTSPANECLFRTSLTQAYVAGSYKVTGLPQCTEDYYEVIATVNNGKSVNKNQAGFINGVVVDGTDITLTKNNAAVEAALNSKLGLQALVAHKFKLESGDIFTVNTFTVNFIRPVDLNMPGGLTLTDARDGGGDAVSFQWNGLLTDWRGKAIVAPIWEQVTDITSFWAINCAPEAKVIPAYQEVTTPAQVTPEYGKVDFTTNGSITLYKATATYKYVTLVSSKNKEFTTTEAYLTQEQAAKALEYMAKSYDAGFYVYAGLASAVFYTEEIKPSGTQIKYEYVKGIVYTPAVYTTHPAQIVLVKHGEDDHTPFPGYNGSSYGDTSGCWIWTKTEFDASAWTKGQYWNFYGAFGNVTLNIAKASTDIQYNGNKLPNEDITLKQDGNSLQYVNAGAKVTSPYVIFIPATVKYGWGTASATLAVTVNPVN